MKVKKSGLCIYLVLLLGILIQLLPTSVSETDISFATFAMLFRLALGAVLIYILGTRRIHKKAILWQIANIVLMMAYTIYSIKVRCFSEAYYNMYLYVLLMSVLCLNIKGCTLPKFAEYFFYILCIILCTVGLLIVFKNQAVSTIISRNYNRYWEKCAYYMVYAGKPVDMYAIHSIAGFMYFQFLSMLYFKNRCKNSWLNRVLMGLFILLIAMLRSNTAIMLLGLGGVMILVKDKAKMSKRSFILKLSFIVIVCVVVCMNMEWIQVIMGSEENGILGRFTGKSLFLQNFLFLKENIIPIGYTSSSSLWLSDCGYIVALLRGGLFNVAVLYGSAYFFFKRNIIDKKMMIPFVVSLFVFEIGYPVLMELKYVMMMPFIVIFLNSVAMEDGKVDEGGIIDENSSRNYSI